MQKLKNIKPFSFAVCFYSWCFIFCVVFIPKFAYCQTWQETLENPFDIVETFDNLQEWTGSNVYYSHDPAEMPKELDGSPSNWDLFSYQPGSPPSPVGPWIGDHGPEYTWGGNGKSLVIDYHKPAGYGPSRLGMYVGDGTPDSGYKKIYVFFMVKFHSGFFPLEQQNPPIFQNLMTLKFLDFEAGFVEPGVYQTPANRATICLTGTVGSVYGTNGTIWNLFSTYSRDDLLLDEMLTTVATWNEGSGCYTYGGGFSDRRVDEARFGSKYLANEWIGMEFMMDIGTLGNNDGSSEVWVYDQNGNVTGHNLDTGINHMQQFNELYNKIAIGGNRQFQDPDTPEDRFYVDDFIIHGSRIGPTYFSLLAGNPPPPDTTPPTISNGLPSGTLPSGTTSVDLTITTNKPAICKYSTTSGIDYLAMVNTFTTTGGTSHSTTISGLQDGQTYNYYVRAQDSDGNTTTNDFQISFFVAMPDFEAPTKPTNPTSQAVSSSHLDLSWDASTDNVGVTGYKMYRDGIEIDTSAYTTYQDTGLNPSTTYTYKISAYDAAGNMSGLSNELSVTTTAYTVTLWIEDSLPAGASGYGTIDSWNWINNGPLPYSGTLAHQSNIAAGVHQHVFAGSTDILAINPGDILFTYIYIDPDNLPSSVMLQWNDGTWEHRAYWGANNLSYGTDGTDSRRYMGPLPQADKWVSLEVPASQVGLEGKILNGMAFTLFDGRATWDFTGKKPFVDVDVTPPSPPRGITIQP